MHVYARTRTRIAMGAPWYSHATPVLMRVARDHASGWQRHGHVRGAYTTRMIVVGACLCMWMAGARMHLRHVMIVADACGS